MKSETALSTYTAVKLRLASVLETLLYFAHERKDESRARFIQELLGDLAEDNFRLAVFGKYNRGKSTLMNALLGMDRLPTGILPLTSVVTTVRYDAQERVQIFREGWALPEDIRMSELTEYVTERGNPGNEKRVTLAQVFSPASILRYGLFLIDTPGIGSSIAANTKAAESFIPRADAAIVVMSIESPLDEEDWLLLERVHSEVKRVFLVLNKTDLLSESERESVIDTVEARAGTLYGNEVPVFPLSARNALKRTEAASETEKDDELQALMEALLRFVKHEKTAQFLNRMAERIRLLVQDEKALEYLVHREEGEKQRLLRHVQDKADAALRAGKREIDALSAAIEQNRAIPSLLSAIWNSTAEQHRRNGGAQRSVKLRELVTEYTATVDRMADFVRSLEEIVPRELLPADGKTPELGAELGSSEIVLNPVPLSAVERFWMKIGIASVPVLRRILLEPGWKKRLARLERDLKQGAQHRIRLLGEEYVRVVTNITEHVKSAVLHAPKSNHGAALAKLSEELEQALRLAREERSQAGVTTRNMSAERSVAHATCCICQHVANVQFHFVRQYQYQLAADPDERTRNAERGGLCAFHTWMYEGISSPQGVCMGYALVPLHFAEQISARIKQGRNTPADGLREFAQELVGELRQCIVCDVIQAAESEKVNELTGNEKLLESASLCLPHLCRIAILDASSSWSHALFEEMSVKLRWMSEDMQQFVLKQSGLRYRWTSSQERSAYINALQTIVGARPLSFVKAVVEI